MSFGFPLNVEYISSNENIDSTRNPYALPTLPPVQSTTPVTSLMFPSNAKYGGAHGNVAAAPVSTCNPTSRDACNGGQCVLIGGGVYTCRCRDGYTGVYCETS